VRRWTVADASRSSPPPELNNVVNGDMIQAAVA
jgi:hypothetical protein